MVSRSLDAANRGGRFPIIDVPIEILADVIRRNRMHGAQKRVRVGKEIEVRIERIFVFAFPRHDDDEAPANDAAQLGDRGAVIQNVFQHMRAHHGIETAVWERQLLDLGRDIIGARRSPSAVDDEVDPDEAPDLRAFRAYPAEQMTRATPHVAHALARRIGDDAFDASLRIVSQSMHPRMLAVERLVFLGRQKWRSGAEAGEMLHVVAPRQSGDRQEQAGVA